MEDVLKFQQCILNHDKCIMVGLKCTALVSFGFDLIIEVH